MVKSTNRTKIFQDDIDHRGDKPKVLICVSELFPMRDIHPNGANIATFLFLVNLTPLCYYELAKRTCIVESAIHLREVPYV